MVERSLSIMTMTLWYDTAYRFITYGSSEFTDHRESKLLVFWAVAATFFGAFLAAALEQLELDLKQRSKAYERREDGVWAPAADALRWKDAGAERPKDGAELTNAELTAALERGTKLRMEQWAACGIAELRTDSYVKVGDSYFRPAEKRHLRLDLVISYSDVVQDSLSWVAGAAALLASPPA